jgi:hypothetical protein
MGRMNPCETSGGGFHAQLLVVYLQGMGGGRSKEMHLCGSELALILPGFYVHACCFRRGTSAQGSGDQQKQVSAGGCVRHDCLILEAPLVDSVDHQTTNLEGAGYSACSWVKMGSSLSTLQYSHEMYRWRFRLALESPLVVPELDEPKSIRGSWCCSNRLQYHHREGDELPNQGVEVQRLA